MGWLGIAFVLSVVFSCHGFFLFECLGPDEFPACDTGKTDSGIRAVSNQGEPPDLHGAKRRKIGG